MNFSTRPLKTLGEEGGEEWTELGAVGDRHEHAAEGSEQQRVDREQRRKQHQRQEPGHHEALDRVDAEHHQGVELLADLAGAEVRGHRRARDPGHHDRAYQRCEFPHHDDHEQATETVDRAE
jgi:hypothetical protein